MLCFVKKKKERTEGACVRVRARACACVRVCPLPASVRLASRKRSQRRVGSVLSGKGSPVAGGEMRRFVPISLSVPFKVWAPCQQMPLSQPRPKA